VFVIDDVFVGDAVADAVADAVGIFYVCFEDAVNYISFRARLVY
jgi:hypothetical protein